MRVFLLCPADKANHRYGLLGPSAIPNVPANPALSPGKSPIRRELSAITPENPEKNAQILLVRADFPVKMAG
jgi:hypothetical protein